MRVELQTAPLEITVISSAAMPDGLRHAVLDLCSRAYAEDFEGYLQLLRTATHLLGSIGRRLASHAAWVERELRSPPTGPMRTAYIEAVATLPEYQGRGFASQLLARIPALVTGFDLAALSPSSEGFYARLGWETWRGPLFYRDHIGTEIATRDEVVMIHRLPSTPATLDLTAPLSTDWRPLEVW